MEVWQDGQLFKDLQKRQVFRLMVDSYTQMALAATKEQIDKDRKELSKLIKKKIAGNIGSRNDSPFKRGTTLIYRNSYNKKSCTKSSFSISNETRRN